MDFLTVPRKYKYLSFIKAFIEKREYEENVLLFFYSGSFDGKK